MPTAWMIRTLDPKIYLLHLYHGRTFHIIISVNVKVKMKISTHSLLLKIWREEFRLFQCSDRLLHVHTIFIVLYASTKSHKTTSQVCHN